MILFDTKAELSSHTAWEHYSWVINVLDTGANSEGGMPIVEAISCCFFHLLMHTHWYVSTKTMDLLLFHDSHLVEQALKYIQLQIFPCAIPTDFKYRRVFPRVFCP